MRIKSLLLLSLLALTSCGASPVSSESISSSSSEESSSSSQEKPELTIKLFELGSSALYKISEESKHDDTFPYTLIFETVDRAIKADLSTMNNFTKDQRKVFNPSLYIDDSLIDSVKSFINEDKTALPYSILPNLTYVNLDEHVEKEYTYINDFTDSGICIAYDAFVTYLVDENVLGTKILNVDENNHYSLAFNRDRIATLSKINTLLQSIDHGEPPSSVGIYSPSSHAFTNSSTYFSTISVHHLDLELCERLKLKIDNIDVTPKYSYSISSSSIVQNINSSIDESVIQYIYKKMISESYQKEMHSPSNVVGFPVNKALYSDTESKQEVQDYKDVVNADAFVYESLSRKELNFMYLLSMMVLDGKEDEEYTFADYIDYCIDEYNGDNNVFDYYTWIKQR